MTGDKSIFSVRTLLAYILLVVFSACQKNKNASAAYTEPIIDSVRILINKSKVKTVSSENKSLLLKKAFLKVKQIQNDSIRCNYYSTLSYRLQKSKDSSLFRQVNREGIQLSKTLQDSVCLTNLLWDLGDYFRNKSVQDSAYYNLYKAEKIANKLGDNSDSGKLLHDMALVQNIIGDHTGSEITTIRAIEKLKPYKNNKVLYQCYNNLGDVTRSLNEYDRALDYYNEALIYLKKTNLGVLRELSLKNNVGLVYQEKEQHTIAVTYFSEVVEYDSIHIKRPFLYGRALNNLGYSRQKLHQFTSLPSLYEQAFKIQDSINDVVGKASSNSRIAEYYLLQKDTVKALHFLKESKKYAEQASDNKKLLEVLLLFSKADLKNASQYSLAYINLNDSLQNQEHQLRNKFTRIRFETDEFIAENQLLARQRQLLAGIAVAILLLGFAASIIIRQRNKNQKLQFRQSQQASDQEIFNLLLSRGEKLEEGKQIEQKRISEELHDGVQGRLQGARMVLIGLNKRDDDQAINERSRAITMLKDIQEEVRAISHALSHAAYQKINNFILSLEDLKTTVSKSSNIEIDFHYSEHLNCDTVNSNIKINLYRIIQECLQNAAKHSQCTKIDLNIAACSDEIKVSIVDNGKGFTLKKDKKGIGMRNIASRMKKIKGTWNISSKIGVGTTITLVIPTFKKDISKKIAKEHENLQQT